MMRAVVGRAGEGKADGHGLGVEAVDYLPETVDHCRQAQVEVVGAGGQGYGVDDILVSAHGAEYEVGASCVEGDYDALVILIHQYEILSGLAMSAEKSVR